MRSQTRLIMACCAGLLVPLLIPLSIGRVLALDDLGTFHIPIRFLYGNALKAGDSFLWTPDFHSGLYLHGEGQAGMMHPFHLLLYRFLPLVRAINIEILGSYLAALAGAVLFLRRLGVSTEGAWFGAMVFAFSGFNLLHLMHVNAIAIVAHVPFLLWTTHALMTSTRRRTVAWAFAATALLIASQLALGYPQYVWMTGVAEAYCVLCFLCGGAAPIRLLLLAGAAVCGVLVGGAQLLPTLDALGGSVRSSIPLDYRLYLSLSPLNLIQLWSPHTFSERVHGGRDLAIPHELSIYDGAFCTLSLVWLAIRWRSLERKVLAGALLGLAALGLVLALGRYAGIYGLLAGLPGLNSFRAPARHVVLVHLAFAGIAAVVFEDLLRVARGGGAIEVRRCWPIALVACLSVVTCMAAAALAPSSWAQAHGLALSTLAQAGPWSGVVVATALLVLLAARRVQWAIPALVILAALDLGVWGYSYVYQQPLDTLEQLGARARVPSAARPGDLIDTSRQPDARNLGVLRGLRLTSGYVALVPATVLDPADPITLRIAGAAWQESSRGWLPVPAPMPRARLMVTARVASDVFHAVQAVDIERVALVSAPIGDLSGAPGQAAVVVDRPGRIVVQTTASGRQLLVTTERFHRGWQATEDGRQLPTLPVYGDYLGCVVNPGRHEVVFRFAPASFRDGLSMSGLGLALTGFATAALAWKPKPLAA
jgi:hypothetical protein